MYYSAQNLTLKMNISLPGPSGEFNEEDIREIHFRVSLTFSFLGVFCNSVVLAIVKKYHHDVEYHKDTILAMNLFINNLLTSFLVTLFMALDAKYLYPTLLNHDTYTAVCKLQLYLEYSILGTEYLILILMGMSRYFMINHHALYQKIFGPQWNYYFILVFSWVVCPLVFVYTLFLPWENISYSIHTSTCHYNGKERDGFFFSTAIFLFTIPIILFTYIAIGIKLFKVRSNLKSHRRKSLDLDRRVPHREKWLVMSVIVLFFKIFVTYLPHTLLIFIDSGNKPDLSMKQINGHMLFLYLRFTNIFTNAISYCVLNSNVRSTIIKLWPFCHGKVHSNNTTSSSNKPENISLSYVGSEAEDNERVTSEETPDLKIQTKPQLEVHGKMPSVADNMRMSFSSNSIYIISTNSVDQEEDCDEMLQEAPTNTDHEILTTSVPHSAGQDVLPSVQITT